MTDAVTAVAAAPVLQPASSRESAPSSPAAAVAPAADDPAPEARAEPQPKPLTVNVQDDSGIFVYTLCDPVTDKVLAVIPDNVVRTGGGNGRHVDQKV